MSVSLLKDISLSKEGQRVAWGMALRQDLEGKEQKSKGYIHIKNTQQTRMKEQAILECSTRADPRLLWPA